MRQAITAVIMSCLILGALVCVLLMPRDHRVHNARILNDRYQFTISCPRSLQECYDNIDALCRRGGQPIKWHVDLSDPPKYLITCDEEGQYAYAY